MNIEGMWPDDLSPTPIELLLRDPARGGEPAALPGGSKERRRLDQVPEDLLIARELGHGGWVTTLSLRRANLAAAYAFVYGSAEGLPGLEGNGDDEVELIGFWD